MKYYLYNKKNMYIPFLLIVLFITSLLVENINTLIPGYINILKSESILVTDYLYIGGLNSTLFNAFTTLLINYILIKLMRLRVSGPIYAGIMLMFGYSFFGINTINFLPIYLGIYIYSKIKKIEYRSLIISILFSCGIASLISYIFFGLGISLFFSIPLGILVGIILGLIIPALASHSIIFHSGYNLYNTGFSLGLISIIAYAILKGFGFDIHFNYVVSYEYHTFLLISLIILIIIFLIVPIIKIKETLINYKKLLNRSGRLIQDFIRDYTHEAVLLNISINLLFCLIVILIFKIQISGPLISSLFAVIGFSAMGKHIKNIYPVIIGGLIAVFVSNLDINNVSVQVGLFFVTCLAPLSGRYNFIIGIIAGFIHLLILNLVADFQGPFNLYLNGFAGGFIAAILISIIESYEQELKYEN